MEKINGKWIHDGREYEVVVAGCVKCCFNNQAGRCKIAIAGQCYETIGLNRCFKLKESKMKKEELNFKVLTPTVERSERLKQALQKVGIDVVPDPEIINAVEIKNGCFLYWSDVTRAYKSFDDCPTPEVTFAEALELLKRVEPVAPEFDIKLRDEVLVRDHGRIWSIAHFAMVQKAIHGMVIFGGNCYQQAIPYTGNEKFLGTTDTPDGWWECAEGKPVWRSK